MDYTTLELLRATQGIESYTDDALLAKLITSASRAIDRACTGSSQADNYFEAEEVANEVLTGRVDAEGRIASWPHKASISSVEAFAYRSSPLSSWVSVSTDYLSVEGAEVRAWLSLAYRDALQVQISYHGGLTDEVDLLPEDLQMAATFLAVRMYNEVKSGLNDVVGVSDLGQVFYSKAMPQRVVELLKPWNRIVPW